MKNGLFFPQGPPPTKIGHFCKNAQNPSQHHYTGWFIILQKGCKILEKTFLTKINPFSPSVDSVHTTPRF